MYSKQQVLPRALQDHCPLSARSFLFLFLFWLKAKWLCLCFLLGLPFPVPIPVPVPGSCALYMCRVHVPCSHSCALPLYAVRRFAISVPVICPFPIAPVPVPVSVSVSMAVLVPVLVPVEFAVAVPVRSPKFQSAVRHPHSGRPARQSESEVC